ncbi:DUF4925 domain-containing protein [Bacteroides timonensis]|uniref:DUF4925 domain-containing protein n=1 Tax=Bacteroides timonensis TaxID=1470345 RepID=UPI0005C48A9F|nr:DUF4925 domain-containing protein [Bacteroides timonensis]
MKKNLFYLFALISSMSLFTACSDDDDEVSPWAGTYKMADYTATDYSWTENTTVKNWPVTGALYTDWQFTGKDNYPEFISALFRHLGGAILPQALNSITLDKSGNIIADYVAEPEIAMDPATIMSIFYTNAFPAASDVKAGFATSGFTTSPKEVAYWSETNGKFIVKLNIPAILTSATGNDASGMAELINQVLSGNPATVKALLGSILGADLSGIQDATISQILSWAKDGVPMNIKTGDNGHTYIYLDKSAFDNLFTLRETGEIDDFEEPVKTNDLTILWNALVAGGIVPEEAQAAGIFISLIGAYWGVTTNFNLGLDLVRI